MLSTKLQQSQSLARSLNWMNQQRKTNLKIRFDEFISVQFIRSHSNDSQQQMKPKINSALLLFIFIFSIILISFNVYWTVYHANAVEISNRMFYTTMRPRIMHCDVRYFPVYHLYRFISFQFRCIQYIWVCTITYVMDIYFAHHRWNAVTRELADVNSEPNTTACDCCRGISKFDFTIT